MSVSCTTDNELLAALKGIRASAARYDMTTDDVVVRLNTGMSISFKPYLAAGLESAEPRHLLQIEISPSGAGLYFPALDADLYVPSLVAGILQPKWLAAGVQCEPAGFSPRPSVEDLYAYTVRWSAEDHEYVATCTGFPSLSWLSPEPDLALIGVRNMVRLALEDMTDSGPLPSA